MQARESLKRLKTIIDVVLYLAATQEETQNQFQQTQKNINLPIKTQDLNDSTAVCGSQNRSKPDKNLLPGILKSTWACWTWVSDWGTRLLHFKCGTALSGICATSPPAEAHRGREAINLASPQ